MQLIIHLPLPNSSLTQGYFSTFLINMQHECCNISREKSKDKEKLNRNPHDFLSLEKGKWFHDLLDRVSFPAIILITLISLIIVPCKIMESFKDVIFFSNNQFNSLLQYGYRWDAYESVLGFLAVLVCQIKSTTYFQGQSFTITLDLCSRVLFVGFDYFFFDLSYVHLYKAAAVCVLESLCVSFLFITMNFADHGLDIALMLPWQQI